MLYIATDDCINRRLTSLVCLDRGCWEQYAGISVNDLKLRPFCDQNGRDSVLPVLNSMDQNVHGIGFIPASLPIPIQIFSRDFIWVPITVSNSLCNPCFCVISQLIQLYHLHWQLNFSNMPSKCDSYKILKYFLIRFLATPLDEGTAHCTCTWRNEMLPVGKRNESS